MNRKKFIRNISSSVLATSAIPFLNFGKSAIKTSTLQNKHPNGASLQSVIKPSRLKKGDTLGLITPGSYISEKELEDSIKSLEGLGFKVTYSENILDRNGYFSSLDSQRAFDLNKMFERRDVKGIVCARGGYGCARILPLLDYDLIKNNPKILTGYSDVTALLCGIFVKTGLICFHGPVGISTFNEFSVNYFDDVLINPKEQLTLNSEVDEKDWEGKNITPIKSGKAKGNLVGGNLSVVVSLIGTEYDIDTTDKILFFEDIGEEPYSIDRMLTQMIMAGKFEKVKGIALGVFKDCESKKENPSFDSSFSLIEVFFERLENLNIPVIYGLSFGHIKNKFTLPIGINAELDVNNQTLTLLEPAVI
jgi:muramoyltetrapeptide carboxypeptidase